MLSTGLTTVNFEAPTLERFIRAKNGKGFCFLIKHLGKYYKMSRRHSNKDNWTTLRCSQHSINKCRFVCRAQNLSGANEILQPGVFWKVENWLMEGIITSPLHSCQGIASNTLFEVAPNIVDYDTDNTVVELR